MVYWVVAIVKVFLIGVQQKSQVKECAIYFGGIILIMKSNKFTKKQLNDYEKYENLRRQGIINMFDLKKGCFITGLEPNEYKFVMCNYTELKEEFGWKK